MLLTGFHIISHNHSHIHSQFFLQHRLLHRYVRPCLSAPKKCKACTVYWAKATRACLELAVLRNHCCVTSEEKTTRGYFFVHVCMEFYVDTRLPSLGRAFASSRSNAKGGWCITERGVIIYSGRCVTCQGVGLFGLACLKLVWP